MTAANVDRRQDGRWVGWSRTFQNSGKSAGERENGRWTYGTNTQDFASSRGEAEHLRQCGVIADHAPDIAPQRVTDDMALDALEEQLAAVSSTACDCKVIRKDGSFRSCERAALADVVVAYPCTCRDVPGCAARYMCGRCLDRLRGGYLFCIECRTTLAAASIELLGGES